MCYSLDMDNTNHTDTESTVNQIRALRSEVARLLRSLPSAERAAMSRRNGVAGGGRPSVVGTFTSIEGGMAGQRGTVLWKRTTGKLRVLFGAGGWKNAIQVQKISATYLSFKEVIVAMETFFKDPKHDLQIAYAAGAVRKPKKAHESPIVSQEETHAPGVTEPVGVVGACQGCWEYDGGKVVGWMCDEHEDKCPNKPKHTPARTSTPQH